MRLLLVWTTILYISISIYAVKRETQLIKHLQPNNVDDWYEFATDSCNCTRTCVRGDNRICYYQFNAENYATLTEACGNCSTTGEFCDQPQCVAADGYQRGILSVNRRIPGPSIQVCEGDKIVVDVINKMSGRSFSIHWHGILQRGTPYYDGVPMVTQCPIFEDNTFRYDFNASPSGTFFWHSHNGMQKVDGLQGSLVIRRPKESDPNRHLYDEDLPAHVITVLDWFHLDSDQRMPGLVSPDPFLYGTFFLINGRGRYTNPTTGETTNTPYSVFHVTPGKRCRFRVIGATCDNCPVRLSVESHRLTLIATDGSSIKPITVDYVEISSGERYDFVLNVDQEVKSYWIKVRGTGRQCATPFSYQLAVLKYDGSTEEEPTTVIPSGADFNVPGVDLNPTNSTCNGAGICVAELEANEYFNPDIFNSPDVTFSMTTGFYYPSLEELYQSNIYERFMHPAGAVDLITTINNISYAETSSPLLTQIDDVDPETYCPVDNNGFPYCDRDHCRCTHIIKIPLHALIQVILLDKSSRGGLNHPLHLHGFAFNIMAMGYLKDMENSELSLEELMKNNSLVKSKYPVMKDTVNVPSNGYTVIRFFSDNPGYWFFHCHFLRHHVVGMSLVLQVGKKRDFARTPPHFPKCGNYKPPVNFRDHGGTCTCPCTRRTPRD